MVALIEMSSLLIGLCGLKMTAFRFIALVLQSSLVSPEVCFLFGWHVKKLNNIYMFMHDVNVLLLSHL